MYNTFVVYPPGAGGNHLKNLLCLSGSFINSIELDETVYDSTVNRTPGEVYCVGGRNLQGIFFQCIQDNPGSSSVLTTHFGELVAHQAQFQQVPDRRLIIITMQHESGRRGLEQRQRRLGQDIHPYWLDEELVCCYRSEMYEKYFDIPSQHCIEIDIQDLWNRETLCSGVLDPIEQFLSIQIPRDHALMLHSKWIDHNWPTVCK